MVSVGLPVHGGAEETDEGAAVEENLLLGPGLGVLLEHGLVEGLVTLDDLGLDLLLGGC